MRRIECSRLSHVPARAALPARLACSSSTTTSDQDRSARRILQRDGYHVLEATNGQEGLELALDHVPDVVLLDISMPVLDGFGLAAALREDERTRELPLIFVTAEIGSGGQGKGVRDGAHGFITKPFDPHARQLVHPQAARSCAPPRTLTVIDGVEGQSS